MTRYILKRILLFIPTLIGVSLIIFFIRVHAPGDPVEQMAGGRLTAQGAGTHLVSSSEEYQRLRQHLGLDKPVFYFKVASWASCDTLYRIPNRQHRQTLERLTYRYGFWPAVEQYYKSVKHLWELTTSPSYSPDSAQQQTLLKLRQQCAKGLTTYHPARIETLIVQTGQLLHTAPPLPNKSLLQKSHRQVRTNFRSLQKNDRPSYQYIPTLHFYGLQNQYHQWMTNFLQGEFGLSYQDRRPVSAVIGGALQWTLLLTLSAVLITFLLSIPLGVSSARSGGGVKDQLISFGLFGLYSLPNFWVATLLIVFLAGGDYLNLFPAYGVGDLPATAPWWKHWAETLYHFTLPVFCLTYPSLAFITRQMRGGMMMTFREEYIRTARAKGVPEQSVIWSHAFRNALFPLITLLGNVFPFIITGSFVIEYIFSIPGMGTVTYEAIRAQDYPVIQTVVMMVSIMTLVGYLVADLLYALVDPRIRYSKVTSQ